jgi:hypothetical protein
MMHRYICTICWDLFQEEKIFKARKELMRHKHENHSY